MGTMSDDQFTKLFKYMHTEFSHLREEMGTTNRKIDVVYELLDADIKKRETDEQERIIINHQLDRYVGWFKQLAKRTNTRLVPEP